MRGNIIHEELGIFCWLLQSFISHINLCFRRHSLTCHRILYKPTQSGLEEVFAGFLYFQALCEPNELPSDHFQWFPTSVRPIQCKSVEFKSLSRDSIERPSSLDSIFARCASIDLQKPSACSQDFALENTAYNAVFNRFQ